MAKREYRRFTVEQKQEVLRMSVQPGVSVSEVCRKFGVAPSVFYSWRAVAQKGSAVALKQEGRRSSGATAGSEEARRQAELTRLRAVIALITAENLELKRRSEAGRFGARTGGHQGGGDRAGGAGKGAFGLSDGAHVAGFGRAAQRVLRGVSARGFDGSNGAATEALRGVASGTSGDLRFRAAACARGLSQADLDDGGCRDRMRGR